MCNMFEETFKLITYINLDHRKDRNSQAIRELSELELNPIRKPGFVPTNIDHPWWKGAVGCMVSHLQILQAADLLGCSVFIFEDDVQFLHKDVTPKHVLNMACMELQTMQWDMLYASGNLLRPCYQVSPHLAKLTHAQSTVGYGVNRKFIPKLLSYFDLSNITAPIDVIYADRVIPENNCYITVPMVAIQRDSYSDIEGRDVEYSSYLEKRYWSNLVKS